MAESPSAELRQAALTLKNPLRCGPVSIMSALADWLDEAADSAEENLTLNDPECPHADAPCPCDPMRAEWYCDICQAWMIPDGCTCWDKPLAVATAVIGVTHGT